MIVRLKYCDQHEEPHHMLYKGHLLLTVTVLQKSRKHPILPAFQTRCNLNLVSQAKMELAHPGLRQPVQLTPLLKLSCQLQYFCRCAYNLATQRCTRSPRLKSSSRLAASKVAQPCSQKCWPKSATKNCIRSKNWCDERNRVHWFQLGNTSVASLLCLGSRLCPGFTCHVAHSLGCLTTCTSANHIFFMFQFWKNVYRMG